MLKVEKPKLLFLIENDLVFEPSSFGDIMEILLRIVGRLKLFLSLFKRNFFECILNTSLLALLHIPKLRQKFRLILEGARRLKFQTKVCVRNDMRRLTDIDIEESKLVVKEWKPISAMNFPT